MVALPLAQETGMRNRFWCAFFVLLLPSVAQAQSAASAIQDFGLLGTWAGECSQAPSPANNHATYAAAPSGAVQLRYQSGEGYEDSIYAILQATLIAPDRLSMRQVLAGNDKVTLDIVLMKENGRIRIWSSAFPDGTPLVEDGVLTTATGRETRWMAHCS
jgi:hypothetical protein